MRQRGLELLALAVGVALINLLPDLALTIEVVVLPLLVLAAGISARYLGRVYRRQGAPRSRFFGMLVNMAWRIVAMGTWVGYLVVARIGDRTGWYFIPAPPPNVSSPISGLVIMVFITPPIIYALAVYRVRRASTIVGPAAAADDLDRE